MRPRSTLLCMRGKRSGVPSSNPPLRYVTRTGQAVRIIQVVVPVFGVSGENVRLQLKLTKSAWTKSRIVYRSWTEIGFVYRFRRKSDPLPAPPRGARETPFAEAQLTGSPAFRGAAGGFPDLYTIPISGRHLYTIPNFVHPKRCSHAIQPGFTSMASTLACLQPRSRT